MPLLNEQDKVYLGNQPLDAVYLGDTKIWPSSWAPSALPGLVSWLDAADYTSGSWPNKGSGPAVTIVGTPAMTAGVPLNGLATVRFKTSEARIRSTWPYPVMDWTLVYLVRFVGPGPGRAWSVQYPPSNLLVGMHTSGDDQMYDNGAFIQGHDVAQWQTTWKMYGADSTSALQRFFIGGSLIGSYSGGYGLDNGWGLSGYDSVATQETMDIEVAELVLYNRQLSDVDRKQVEDYLNNKWFGPRWDADTQAYLAATGLDASYAPALDGLVTGLKAAGLWTKMQAIYPFIGGTAALHKWNLKDPRDTDSAYRLTFVAGDPSQHSLALGYRANEQGQQVGSPRFADTHFVPLGLMDVNSTHLAFYSLENTPSADRAEMGCYDWNGPGSRFHVIARYLGVDSFYYGMSEDGANHYVVPAASGLFVSTRTAADAQRGYRNGVPGPADSFPPANGLPNRSVYIGAINEFQNRSDIPCGFASIGSGLTAANVLDLYTMVQAYQTALGRQI